MKSRSRFTTVLAILLCVAFVVSACSSAPAAPSAKPEEKAPPAAAAKPAEQAKTEAPAKPAEPAKPVSKEPYKLGLLISLSGPVAAPGGEVRDGAMLEVERINAAGGIDGHQIQLIVEDDGSDVTKGVAAATKLIRQDNVLAVMGPLYSDIDMPLAQMAEREKVPVIQTNPSVADAVDTKFRNYTYVFSTVPAHPLIAAATLETLKLKGYKKVIVMADAVSPFPASLDAVVKGASAQGIQVIALSDTWTNTDMDLMAQATKAKDAAAREKPDALVLLTNGISGVNFLKGMQQIGFKIPVVGSPAFGMAAMVKMGGGLVEGIVFPASKIFEPQALPDSDPQKRVALDFTQRFEAKYKYPVGQMSAMGGDAVNLAAISLKTSGADRIKLRDALEKTSGYVGLAGTFNYKPDDHEGLAVDSQAIYEVKGGKFKLLAVVPKAR